MRHRPSHVIEYAALRALVALVGLLPLWAALEAGALLGRAAWALGIRRRVVMTNLAQAFPAIDGRAARRIGSGSYANAGRFMIEFARQDRLGCGHISRWISVENPGNLERLAREGGIGLAFHFGNWELLGALMKCRGADVSLLVGEQHNPLVDRLINRLRSVHGIGLITRDAAMRGIFRAVRAGGAVCWLSDQDAGRNGVVVDFFGYPASTPRGAAAFAIRLGCAVYPVFMVRERGRRQRAVFTDPILPPQGVPQEEAEARVTQEYTKRLEEMVVRHPEMYWWPHRRWKTTGLYGGHPTIPGAEVREVR